MRSDWVCMNIMTDHRSRGTHACGGHAAHGTRRRSRGQHLGGAAVAQQRVAARHQRSRAGRVQADDAAAVVAIVVIRASSIASRAAAGLTSRGARRWRRRRMVDEAHPWEELLKEGV